MKISYILSGQSVWCVGGESKLQAVDFGFDHSFQQRQQDNTRDRLSYRLDQKAFFQKIDAIPALIGAGVIYTDGVNVVKLRAFEPICFTNPVYVVLKEAPPIQQKTRLASELTSGARNSKLAGELVGVGLSCGAAVLSWVVVAGASAVIPATGGVSTAVVVLTYAAAVASSAQCVNSIVRTSFEVTDPSTNDWLDSQQWYTNTSLALDVISVGGAVASGFATIKLMLTTRAATGKSFTEILKGMSRAERKRLTEEIIRVNHPGISNGALKSMVRSNLYPKRFSNIQITEALKLQIKDAIGATLSFTGSATAGSVNGIAVGIYEGTTDR